MLTGRTLDMHHQMFGRGTSALTRKDWLAVRNTFIQFDEVNKVLRALPTPLILVIRNLNIVRSLNRSLQCPVNRFTIMARWWVWFSGWLWFVHVANLSLCCGAVLSRVVRWTSQEVVKGSYPPGAVIQQHGGRALCLKPDYGELRVWSYLTLSFLLSL